MPSDKEQKKSPEEEAEEKKYSFLQEKIKGKQGSRETLIKQFIRIAIYGLILGMFACLGFFATGNRWMQQWFAGNAKTVMIPEDEQAAEDSEKNQEGKEDPALDAESYGRDDPAGLNERVKEARKSLVSVSSGI